MGVSGVGKTTLLNLLSGINKPTAGKILINGIDLYSREGKRNLKGVIGYIAQDDLLIEELSVFDNLYFNAKLCFADRTEEQIRYKVEDMLRTLGLWERKNLKVGNVLDKKISGGQRKRLNIALELIREPSILFVDEPTSGLSSRDSENVMDLLKELTYKGKLIFVVIHQPSSDIYKMFDKIYILDDGGTPIYYGNPVEAITYFKRATRQLDSERGICITCGNVNPEQIFNIVEERSVDEYGNFIERRKVTPRQWEDLFKKTVPVTRVPDVTELPPRLLKIPSRPGQVLIFLRRDLLKKLADRQYLVINLLESPVLALILAVIVRYNNYSNNSQYRFRFNDNFPVFIMMSIIVALFFGLMVSAEEIIGDRKILKRESFLNLSWNSYLVSKLALLFIISAIQTSTFVLISNSILGIRGMFFPFWIMLFSVSCFGNLLGLNISSAFRTTVTVYILIPLLIIPQMILSGLLVSFDKINEIIGNKSKVPLIADFITTRWAYEAMAVYQFKNNAYELPLFPIEAEEYESGYKSTFFVEKMSDLIQTAENLADDSDSAGQSDDTGSRQKALNHILGIIRHEISQEPLTPSIGQGVLGLITPENFRDKKVGPLLKYLEKLKSVYREQSNKADAKKEKAMSILNNIYLKSGLTLDAMKNRYYNNKLADLVRNSGSMDKVTVYHDKIVQLADPVFNTEIHPGSLIDYRTQFFSPVKPFFFHIFDTFWFNFCAIWLQALFLYVLLYFEILRKVLEGMRKSRRLSPA